MKTRSQLRKSGGFTLIELLVVMTIIVVLVGMLFVGISAGMRQARVFKTQTMVKNLEGAFRAYYNEYGKWPGNTSGIQSVSPTYSDMLQGVTSTLNPRGIVFMQFSTSGGALINPSDPGVGYSCMFDVNGTGSLTFSYGTNNVSERTGVLVWGYNAFISNPNNPSRCIGSW
jgi:prepilin-type N-terminal cleavage/methylation domain-containing protein